jgi:hypothetical protein
MGGHPDRRGVRSTLAPGRVAVIVSGVDHESGSVTSAPGASWVFTMRQLVDARAFLATAMNGDPLPPDHGAPVRLFVPGWYGCACIKWVDALSFTDDRVAATGQMKEFAARTHQSGVPALARDYEPATIDLAAMPVRVEKWRVGGRLVHADRRRGVGRGGRDPAARDPRQSARALCADQRCQPPPPAACTTIGAIWTHVWQPPAPGRYQLVVKTAEPRVRTRRLDLYFYTRTVRIDEV